MSWSITTPVGACNCHGCTCAGCDECREPDEPTLRDWTPPDPSTVDPDPWGTAS